MEFKKKTIIWEDNNEPPKDYIWAKKDGKFYEYSYATRSWVESKLIKTEESGSSGGSDDIPSGDITIDDVVKFIHDTTEKDEPGLFPYTTWNDIPDYEDVNINEVCKVYDAPAIGFNEIILIAFPYIIGIKGEQIIPINPAG